MLGCGDHDLSVLLSHLAEVEVERIEQMGGVVRISARTASSPVACPSCGSVSSRVHSRYGRRLADTAVGGQRTAIVLEVRRLFCDEPDCDRRTFAEQVPGLTVRYGRRTLVLRPCWRRSRSRWRAGQALTEDECPQLKEILERCPQLRAASEHVRAFGEMLTGLQGHNLPEWIAAVQADDRAQHTAPQ
jgi:transposase